MTTKLPCKISTPLPGSPPNHLVKIHGKSEERYTITAQYGLCGSKDDFNRFRLVVVDEAFGKTDEENSQRALDLFNELGLQLVVINPFDAKSRIVEDYVHSYHLVTMQDEVSSLRRASREEYEAAREGN